MKIYLLVLLGLAAGDAVNTISNSSTSDSTVAAPPDSSAPVAASSDTSTTASLTSSSPSSTNPTSSHSSIGSIESTNSSTSSPTAPAGDDIRDISVLMTFAVEAIDDGSDKEIISKFEKSVAASLDRALGTDATMTKIAVVENAPAGRRLGVATLSIVYDVEVKESFEEAAKAAIHSPIFNTNFATSMNASDPKLAPNTGVTTSKMCSTSSIPKLVGGSIACTIAERTPSNGSACTLTCTAAKGYKAKTGGPAHINKCGSDGEWAGAVGECEKKKCPSGSEASSLVPPSNGLMVDCSNGRDLAFSSTACTLVCKKNYKESGTITKTCQADGTWSSTGAVSTCVAAVCGVHASSNLATGGGAPTVPSSFVGTIDCNPAKLATSGKSCTLECPVTHYKEKGSNTKCIAEDTWAGAAGLCTKKCPPLSAGKFCKSSSTIIGKCTLDNVGDDPEVNSSPVSCVATSETVCGNSETGVCGNVTVRTLQGTCSGGNCTHNEMVMVTAKTIVKLDDTMTNYANIVKGIDTTFNAQFKEAVAGTLEGLGIGDNLAVSIVSPTTRRLNAKFLEDAPARMLEVEYSVQVNESNAADAKTALDKFTTLMYSSNST